MINFRNAIFIKSAPDVAHAPEARFNEILFVGKSNVGKSSLINAITNNKNLAKTSSTPGHTKLLNYFLIDKNYYLVDAPGYGYTYQGESFSFDFGEMMEGYFSNNPYLKGVVFIVDSRHEPSKEDIDFYKFIKRSHIPFVIAASKCDKLNQSEKAKILKNITNAFGDVKNIDICYTSIKDNKSIDLLKHKCEALMHS